MSRPTKVEIFLSAPRSDQKDVILNASADGIAFDSSQLLVAHSMAVSVGILALKQRPTSKKSGRFIGQARRRSVKVEHKPM